ncbi:hypothetical protein FNV43_RR06651 [Rhamnella rubrinervis]|uniref:Uncharacterized protein n=1 Tax=Rhamnella rubrinervis TaxID=2594499 RepID=A0A8K0MLM8_9ROSA|nr:hypothetical protein FNV43_RR06651 [Rhamnella rubrinervis]
MANLGNLVLPLNCSMTFFFLQIFLTRVSRAQFVVWSTSPDKWNGIIAQKRGRRWLDWLHIKSPRVKHSVCL